MAAAQTKANSVGVILEPRPKWEIRPKGILSQEVFNGTLERLQAATQGTTVRAPIQAMEVLSQSLGLTQEENQSGLMNLMEDGDYTKWGMCNAITKIANTTENYDRASELENFGGKIIDLPTREWTKIAEAA